MMDEGEFALATLGLMAVVLVVLFLAGLGVGLNAEATTREETIHWVETCWPNKPVWTENPGTCWVNGMKVVVE